MSYMTQICNADVDDMEADHLISTPMISMTQTTCDFSLLGGVQAPTQLRRTRAPPLAERSYLLGGGDRYGAFPTFRLHKASQVNRLLG